MKVIPFKREWDFGNFKVVVVLVRNGETEDQAWQRYLRENPEDLQADIKIYHVTWAPE